MNAAVAGSVAEALAAATDALEAAGVETPGLDARLLLAEATGIHGAGLIAAPEAGVDAAAGRAFGAMVRRRVQREPVAYILGRKGFRRIELEVDPRVLIPRPETELLVELALEVGPGRALDVGTGSGAIALAIADELPGTEMTATDTSLDALAVAKANRDRLGSTDRVRLAHGTLESGPFDLVLANLPYVSEREWEGVAAEIRGFEPREALVAGPSGLEAIEGLLGELSIAAAPAAIGLEVGIGQAPAVAGLARRAGFERIEIRADLAGIDRVVAGWS
ncbi:MAG: release factor glutamine methyltransferase [Solirubrobacterales bacterium]|jgi:release factor glutamine methyltransferase|nr:release factor glutamine methyltransferase [Solirubrobacterales bacterium]